MLDEVVVFHTIPGKVKKDNHRIYDAELNKSEEK